MWPALHIDAVIVLFGVMPRRRLAAVLWLSLLGWAAAILWLSSLAPRELPQAAFLLWDKINHFLAYVLGGWLAARSLRVSWPRISKALTAAVAVAMIAAFGALDEWVQEFTPGRSGGDVRDWIADVLGAIVGASLGALTGRKRRR